jgi:aspartate/methionine/tyrosine aminotransferase
MLLTPDGMSAGTTDRIMLLAMWADHLEMHSSANQKKIIVAGIGKPTFPVNLFAAAAAATFWQGFWSRSQDTKHTLTNHNCSSSTTGNISASNSAIDEGDPAGNFEYRQQMAGALNRWYEGIQITSDNILFTYGGAGALYIIFKMLQEKIPNCIILTPFPHYTLYAGFNPKNHLFPIDVMKEKGYQLTAEAFEKSLKAAEELAAKSGQTVGAFLLCDPNNPLGTIADKVELTKIAGILKKHPNILIILDEAYAEMQFTGRHLSLFTIAKELKERFIVIRSGTKALSAAGERLGVVVALDEELMRKLIQISFELVGHAPLSSQCAFSEALDKLGERELKLLNEYYRPQVDYVYKRLRDMGAAMPNPSYEVRGTFYVCGDFSDLLGKEIPIAAKMALNKTGQIENGEDIAYSLLFQDSIMIAPLSYFGLTGKHGYMRITCSAGDNELKELMDRLENRLLAARKIKKQDLEDRVSALLLRLKNIYPDKHPQVLRQLFEAQQKIGKTVTALNLKEYLTTVEDILFKTETFYLSNEANRNPENKVKAATKIQVTFRGFLGKKQTEKLRASVGADWNDFICKHIGEGLMRSHLLSISSSTERAKFPGWQTYLLSKNPERTSNSSASTKDPLTPISLDSSGSSNGSISISASPSRVLAPETPSTFDINGPSK